jgi:predicted nucleic acid-binding protein
MLPKILDANRLIRHWRAAPPRSIADARKSAGDLCERHGTRAIVTPVVIELLGGTRDKDELARARAFLAEFQIIDAGRILPEDFVRARALAERIPHVFRPRTFADCLIRAIADRLHYDVDTADAGMPRSLPQRKEGKPGRTNRPS